jgi:hypothetical protein
MDAITPKEAEELHLDLEAFGFVRLPRTVPPAALKDLQHEAAEQSASALKAESARAQYRARIAALGPRAERFLRSASLTDSLSGVFGGRFTLTAERSCLTVYGEGDHLGPHLDTPAEECAVTILVYLVATRQAYPALPTGLALHVYGLDMPGDRMPVLTIPTQTGAIVVGNGSRFWHGRPMLQKGEMVVALTGCYRHVTSADVGLGVMPTPNRSLP